jgi:hypothetical protein
MSRQHLEQHHSAYKNAYNSFLNELSSFEWPRSEFVPHLLPVGCSESARIIAARFLTLSSALSGKGDADAALLLWRIDDLLPPAKGHVTIELVPFAFDGDSCFSQPYGQFQEGWMVCLTRPISTRVSSN